MEIIVGIFPSFNVQDALLWGSRPLCFHELTSDLLEDCININSTTLQNEIKALAESVFSFTLKTNKKTDVDLFVALFKRLNTKLKILHYR